MSGISKYTYATLTTAIRDYTEVGATVLTQTIIDGFIMAAENRIFYEIPMDSDRRQQSTTMVTGQQTLNCPDGALFTRGIQVYTATNGAITGASTWLEKRDQTFLNEYISANTTTGVPKYYAQFGGATAAGTGTSGHYMFSPVPSATFSVQIHYNKMPVGLGSGGDGNSDTYISTYFSQGLLYACLTEAFAFLKGPTDMLTLYENKYKQEIEKFAALQLGRRRRDDYTDGTVRIQVPSPSQ